MRCFALMQIKGSFRRAIHVLGHNRIEHTSYHIRISFPPQSPVIVHAAQIKILTTAHSQLPAAGSDPCVRVWCSKTCTERHTSKKGLVCT
jgi:hypothetical protein